MSTQTKDLVVSEVTSLQDPRWSGWLPIYLDSFPPKERMTVGFFERFLKRKSDGDPAEGRMVVLTPRDDPSDVACIAFYETDVDARITFLWYLATSQERRGRGIGRIVYEHAREEARACGAELLVFEVEIPPGGAGEAEATERWAERRIQWYRRQGARILAGIRYLQGVDFTDEKTEMHLMVEAFGSDDPARIFESLKGYFGDSITRVGDLALL